MCGRDVRLNPASKNQKEIGQGQGQIGEMTRTRRGTGGQGGTGAKYELPRYSIILYLEFISNYYPVTPG